MPAFRRRAACHCVDCQQRRHPTQPGSPPGYTRSAIQAACATGHGQRSSAVPTGCLLPQAAAMVMGAFMGFHRHSPMK
jgi:hypothetical protein